MFFFSACYLDYNRRFADFVLKQIHIRLVDKESNKANNWVPLEAMELRYRGGYGTFDEALVHCVEEKLKPIWAKLIMEMDLNDNLLLLNVSGRTEEYRLELWFNFAELACSLSSLVTEMTARIDRCTFPFSQYTIPVVDSIIRESSNILGKGFHFRNEFFIILHQYCFGPKVQKNFARQ